MHLATAGGRDVVREPLAVGRGAGVEDEIRVRRPDGAELEAVHAHGARHLGEVEHDVAGELLVGALRRGPPLEVELPERLGARSHTHDQRGFGGRLVAVRSVHLDGAVGDVGVVDHVRAIRREAGGEGHAALHRDRDARRELRIRVGGGEPHEARVRPRDVLGGIGEVVRHAVELRGERGEVRPGEGDDLEVDVPAVRVRYAQEVRARRGSDAAAPLIRGQPVNGRELHDGEGLGGVHGNRAGAVAVGEIEGPGPGEGPREDPHGDPVDRGHRVIGLAGDGVHDRVPVLVRRGDGPRRGDGALELAVAEAHIALREDREALIDVERVEGGSVRSGRGRRVASQRDSREEQNCPRLRDSPPLTPAHRRAALDAIHRCSPSIRICSTTTAFWSPRPQ